MRPEDQCRLCGGQRSRGRHSHLVCFGDGDIPHEEEDRLARIQEVRSAKGP